MQAPWSIRMAWRDSRGSRRRLVLFATAMVVGVAAVVAIHGFGANLSTAVDSQARTLLGADLSFEQSSSFSDSTEALIDSIGGEHARQVSFTSMALFPEHDRTRLSSIRALEGDYPFYGDLVTVPARAAQTYHQEGQALVDATLMEQFGLVPGDSVRVGDVSYAIAGRLEQTPRENSFIRAFSPRIYVPRARLDTTLLARGSRAEYEVYFKFDDDRDVDALVKEIEPYLRRNHVGFDTVEEARGNWSEGLTNINRFLSLVAFLALLMGGMGIASAVHVYVKRRLETVAVLRCLGASSGRTFRVYLVQAVAMGLVCAVAGGLLGLVLQAILPIVLADFLPVDVPFRVAWGPLAMGLVVGLSVTVLFALLPLVQVRRVPPLRALRSAYAAEAEGRDWLRWALLAVLGAVIAVAAILQAPVWEVGVGYAVAVLTVFGLLGTVGWGIMWLTRRFFPSGWAYPWRQGVANLFRPQNQTVMLTLALGFGTFLVVTLFLMQSTLLAQIEVADREGQPNLVLFDVQQEEVDEVVATLEEQGVPVLERVPIVTMRLSSVGGRTVEEMRADTTADVTWAHRREYRSTYRDYLTDSEEVVEGEFVGEVEPDTEPVPVSVEEEIMAELGVEVGDTLIFDVQGLPVETVIASKRTVDWRQVSTNFFVVFPKGSIEDAPQQFVVLSRTEEAGASARIQSAVVERFPSVSIIDISMVMSVFDEVFSQLAFVVRFMALFSIVTGLVVLAGAVAVSRVQRIEESVLLKTLGASRRQVFQVMLAEYTALGLLASLAGVVLSLGAGWALARFVFETPFVVAPLMLVAAVLFVTALTVGIGLLNSRGVYDRPALEVLRSRV